MVTGLWRGHLRVRTLIILTQFLDDSIPWCHTCKYVQPNEPGVGCAYVQYNNVNHYYGLGEGTMDRSVLKLYAGKGPAVVVNIWSMDPLVRRLSLWWPRRDFGRPWSKMVMLSCYTRSWYGWKLRKKILVSHQKRRFIEHTRISMYWYKRFFSYFITTFYSAHNVIFAIKINNN